MRSLRWQLFAAVTGLTLLFVTLSGVLNTFFLEKYYRTEKENTLKKVSQEINSRYQGSPNKIAAYLSSLERTTGLRIAIFDTNLSARYDTMENQFLAETLPLPAEMTESEMENFPPKPYPPDSDHNFLTQEVIKPNQDSLKAGQTVLVVVKDPGSKDDRFLNCALRLHDGEYLVVSTPLAVIKESSDVANRFFVFIGLLTVVLGLVTAYLLAEKFTHPIQELNNVAMNMADLRFDARCKVDSSNEIGQLAASINSLSAQLDLAINELRASNEKLQEDVDRERKIDQMRQEFISNVSHEIKTPIALIEGYVEGLKFNVIHDETIKNEYCDIIMDETYKMNRLINSLLELSKLESGYFALERTQFDLNEYISDFLLKLRPLFKQKEVTLHWDPQGVIWVDADEFYVEQVLTNLVGNALRHVKVPGVIQVTAEVNADEVRVAIENSGVAIPGEELEKIWLPFYKVDKSHTRNDGGSGLGLSIVKAIQELHGNSYGVINTDRGVQFWFTLDQAESGSC